MSSNYRIALAGLVFMGLAGPALAQSETPKAELSAGYNYLAAKSQDDDGWTKYPKGWYGDFAAKATKSLAVVGQVTGHYKTIEDDGFSIKARVHGFMGGVRGSSQRSKSVKPYGQVLAGVIRIKLSSGSFRAAESDLALQFGGGVNLGGKSRIGGRVGLDYLRVFGKEGGDVSGGAGANVVTVSAGVTIAVGNR